MYIYIFKVGQNNINKQILDGDHISFRIELCNSIFWQVWLELMFFKLAKLRGLFHYLCFKIQINITDFFHYSFLDEQNSGI